MRRVFLNIRQLFGLYFMSFLSAALVVALFLICYSVRASCTQAYAKLDSFYTVSLQIALKERNEIVLNEKGKTEIVNQNTRLIDSEVLDIIHAEDRISNIEYITNSFYFPIGLICTPEEYANIRESMNAGKAFEGVCSYYVKNETVKYDIGVIGCTSESLIEEALQTDEVTITYFTGHSFSNGILLPKALYDSLDEPDEIIIGWYKSSHSGASVMEKQDDGTYEIKPEHTEFIKSLINVPSPPLLHVDIAGYYVSDSKNDYIFSDKETWEKLYLSQDYYKYNNHTQTYYRSDANATNEVGISALRMVLNSPKMTEDVIKSLMVSGLDSNSFRIRANDYDYKFAVSQIDSIKGFVDIAYYFSMIFGVLIVLIIVRYTLEKRKNEIYIRRTLGESNIKSTLCIGTEISVVLLMGIVFGILLSVGLGNGISEAINYKSEMNAKNSIENLSQIAEFMANNEELKTQLNHAIQSYLNSNISLSYYVPFTVYTAIIPVWVIISVYAMFVIKKLSAVCLMKKEL